MTGEVLPPLWLTLWPFGDRPLPAARRSGLAIAAAVGIAAGALAAALSGNLSLADAASRRAAALDLRDAPIVAPTVGGRNGAARGAAIERLVSTGAPERLGADFAPTPRVPTHRAPSRRAPPSIVVVFDDVGIDRRGFETLMALPGPLTLSFLPYADDVQAMADRARARGHAILLHLPMEPSGGADPGPGALTASMSGSDLFAALGANLAQFEGYAGVNNHMGSKLTRDDQAMKRILAFLDSRGLFFLDSLTTGKSVASAAGAAVGAEVLVRDLFLDAEPGGAAIRRQLALAEKIAAETGYVIAIAHPRAETLAEIGPWLTSAPARGFRLETIAGLRGARSGAYAANAADARLR